MKLKPFILLLMVALHLISSPTDCMANQLSSQALQGKWMFTHILMDEGSREVKVNQVMEFLPDGSIINYDALGNEHSRGTFEITDNVILYKDPNGEQKWKLVSFEGNRLHVDHGGAEMFFEKL